MQLDFVTKLGGSAITNKKCFETLDRNALTQAAEVLKTCYEKGLRFIVVHGAGSFGHHQAKEYDVNKGYKEEEALKQHLNHIVVTTLVHHGIPAVSVSPCGNWTTNEGVLVTDGTAVLHQLLCEGYVPCLHGDCVLDLAQGCAILSGDVILERLCEVFSPNRAIFFTDVKGVYTKSPHEADAQLIPRIIVPYDERVTNQLNLSAGTSPDVTGGIALKVDCASKIVRHHNGRVYVVICTGVAYHNVCLTGSLDGESGTIIEYDKTSQSSNK